MNQKPVIVIGAGGHAKVLIDALQLLKVKILGVLDPSPELVAGDLLGVPLLGDDDVIDNFSVEDVGLVNGIGSTSHPQLRRDIYLRFKQKGYSFQNVVHPSAIVSGHAVLMEGVQVLAGAIVQAGSVLNEDVIVNTSASVDHDCSIGAHSHIAPGCTISGGVVVEMGCHVGSGATVIQGVRLGKDVVVGAGSVVIRDVPSGAKALGVPAKVKA